MGIVGKLAFVLMALGITVLTGCTTLPEKPKNVAGITKNANGTSVDVNTLTYNSGLSYAFSLRDSYDNFTREQDGNSAAAGRTTAGAAIGAISATAFQANKDVIVGFGLIGGAVAGMAQFIQNKPKQQVYRVGVSALQCLINKFEPLALTDQSRLRFDDSIVALKSNLKTLSQTIADAEGDQSLMGAMPSDGASLLEIAKQRQQDASKLLSQATSTKLALDRIGLTIVNAADSIDNEITTAALATEPDLAALPTTLQNRVQLPAQQILGALAPSVTPGPNAQLTLKANLARLQRGNVGASTILESLANAIVDVTNAQASLKDDLQSINLVTSEGLSDCFNQAKAATEQSRIKVEPSDILVIKRAGPAGVLLVSGGTSSYVLQPLWDNSDNKLQINDQIFSGMSRLEITATDKSAVQSYQLLIRDSAGAEKLITISVAAEAVAVERKQQVLPKGTAHSQRASPKSVK